MQFIKTGTVVVVHRNAKAINGGRGRLPDGNIQCVVVSPMLASYIGQGWTIVGSPPAYANLIAVFRVLGSPLVVKQLRRESEPATVIVSGDFSVVMLTEFDTQA